MTNCSILILDEDDYTWSVIQSDLEQRGYKNLTRIKNGMQLPVELKHFLPDIVIFNYQYHQPDSVMLCNLVKTMAPEAAVIAIVSSGPASKAVRLWASQTNCIDVVIEKPLSDERFFMTLKDISKGKQAAKILNQRTKMLESLIPEAAVVAVDGAEVNKEEAELVEAAVLFTDIRRSSQAITNFPPREFFALLNQMLSQQAKMIREHQGSVIKYTGDGVMAVFRGVGRSHLALRSALKLAENSKTSPLPFGVGLAEGLVMAGMVGDANHSGQRKQYDVIGATVHLASRLCSMAEVSEVIATQQLHHAARLYEPSTRQIGQISVRGFDQGIDCVAFSYAGIDSIGVTK